MTTYSVFVLRGQPFHKAHLQTIKTALQKSDRVIVVIGSYRTPITIRNPWSFEVRKDFIRGSLTADENARVKIDCIRDFLYSPPTWITSLQSVVVSNTDPDDDISLLGHFKDDTSYYLKWFPQWKLFSLPRFKEGEESIDGTTIRNLMFENNPKWKTYVPDYVVSVLEKYIGKPEVFTEEYLRLQNEYRFIERYKKSWEKAPYPPTFVTTDAVVVQSGHVLLVVRGRDPGKGYYALPGGFLDQNETIKQGTIRELKEETKIDVPAIILEKSIKETVTFDHPLRSLRGRIISHASLIELDYNNLLPKVKGGDDAAEALWMPFNEIGLHEEKMFDDHLHIISYFMSGKLYNRYL